MCVRSKAIALIEDETNTPRLFKEDAHGADRVDAAAHEGLAHLEVDEGTLRRLAAVAHG